MEYYFGEIFLTSNTSLYAHQLENTTRLWEKPARKKLQALNQGV